MYLQLYVALHGSRSNWIWNMETWNILHWSLVCLFFWTVWYLVHLFPFPRGSRGSEPPYTRRALQEALCASTLELVARAHHFILSQQMVKRPCLKQDTTVSWCQAQPGQVTFTSVPARPQLTPFPHQSKWVNLILLNFLINHVLLPRPSLQLLHLLCPWILTHNFNEQNMMTHTTWDHRKCGNAIRPCYQLLCI